MATSQNLVGADQPIYAKQDFLNIEAELERAGSHIEYRGRAGWYFKKANPLPGQSLDDAAPNSMIVRNYIEFVGERALNVATANGWDQWLTPMVVSTKPIHGPNIDTHTAATYMTNEILDWESNPICTNLYNTLKGILPANIDKIVAFGIGRIGNVHLNSPDRLFDVQSFREYAYLLTVAKALNDRKAAGEEQVAIYVQDPTYTSVCKEVLSRDFGFHIIGGYGARGFAMVDENTLVAGHHPNFPLREIIADIARPAAMCWPFWGKHEFDRLPTRNKIIAADIETDRVRAMLEEYQEVPIPGTRSKNNTLGQSEWNIAWLEEPFYDSKWYVRKSKVSSY
ncbi:hypothetical protein F4774DRAFT_426886 [Daldinia eschscholtzii]|nr:hypothetical protein F4774DRAFT_426886 [Daldinia eschscholtzii]